MPSDVRLRPQVLEDLAAIFDHIAASSLEIAKRFLSQIEPTLNDLARTPGKGSLKQFRSPALAGVRSWNVPGFRNHLILYREVADGIEVLAIAHGARHLARLLRKRSS